ncbi:MAG TPA: DedA family protein [Tepidisphaeraceae bacterium]|nr:DedA family protein [Tepidisphaeraceae bacterium]
MLALVLALAFTFTTVQQWVTTRGFYGGVAVTFLLLFACGLGLPLPEDIPLIIGGAFLCTDARSWIITGTAAWLGIIGGDCVLYFMGRRYGMEITRVPVIGKHVTRERIERVQGMFERYGIGVVAVGRLFAGIRGAMVICAGTIKFSFWKFLLADGLAAIISGGLFMLLGWWIGAKLNDPAAQKKIHEFKWFFLAAAIAAVIGFVSFILWRRRNAHKIEAVEEKVVAKVAQAEKKVAQTIVQAAEKVVGKTPTTEREEAPAPTGGSAEQR